MTEVRGAIAGTQNNFLFFLPCQNNESEKMMVYYYLSSNNNIIDSTYNIFGEQEESQEGDAYSYCLPVPLSHKQS